MHVSMFVNLDGFNIDTSVAVKSQFIEKPFKLRSNAKSVNGE